MRFINSCKTTVSFSSKEEARAAGTQLMLQKNLIIERDSVVGLMGPNFYNKLVNEIKGKRLNELTVDWFSVQDNFHIRVFSINDFEKIVGKLNLL